MFLSGALAVKTSVLQRCRAERQSLHARTHPDEGVLEDGDNGAMDAVADVLHRAAAPHDDGVAELRVLARLLGIDPDQRQHVPQTEQQVVQVQLHVAAAGGR